MTKGRAKTNSSDAIDPPQRWALRSRKRECPNDKACPSDDIYHQQDTNELSAACVSTPPQSPQSPLKECIMISVQQKQAAEPMFITKQDTTEENGVNDYDLTAKTCDMQEMTTIFIPSSIVQSQGCTLDCDSDTNKDGKKKEQKKAPNCCKSTTKTCTEPTQIFIAMSEEGNESKASDLKDELSTEDNPDHKMETNNEESNSVCMDDAKEKEAIVGLPTKKKRRMGVCHLTEKERNQFLLAQNCANGKPQKERQTCKDVDDQVAERETVCPPHTPSSPQHNPVTLSGREESEAEIKLQSSGDSGEDSAERDVTSTVADPHSSHVNICEAKTPRALDPEQILELHPHGEVKEKLNDQERQEDVGVSEIPENKTKNMADVPAEVGPNPAITFHTSTNWTEETMKENQDVNKTPTEQVHNDEMNEDVTGDDEDNGPKVESSSTDVSADVSDGSGGIYKAPVTPLGSERTSTYGPDEDPGFGPCPLDTDPPQTREPEDLFGSGALDYVSDSQLNTIVLIEEETMNREACVGSSDVYEDGTNLISGLIRELSSLNRTLMATHRELENLRYKSKNSKSSLY